MPSKELDYDQSCLHKVTLEEEIKHFRILLSDKVNTKAGTTVEPNLNNETISNVIKRALWEEANQGLARFYPANETGKKYYEESNRPERPEVFAYIAKMKEKNLLPLENGSLFLFERIVLQWLNSRNTPETSRINYQVPVSEGHGLDPYTVAAKL